MYYKKSHKRRQSKLAKNSWPSYTLLIIGSSGSGKTTALLNLINEEWDCLIFLYAKDPYGKNYKWLPSKREIIGLT